MALEGARYANAAELHKAIQKRNVTRYLSECHRMSEDGLMDLSVRLSDAKEETDQVLLTAVDWLDEQKAQATWRREGLLQRLGFPGLWP